SPPGQRCAHRHRHRRSGRHPPRHRAQGGGGGCAVAAGRTRHSGPAGICRAPAVELLIVNRRRSRLVLAVAACIAAAPLAAQDASPAPPSAESGETDTLKEALALAYRHNPNLEVARANLRATDAGVPLARADALPSLNGQGTFTEFLKQGSSSLVSPERSLSGQLNLALPLYAGGATKNAIRAAETRVDAGRADLRGSESQLFTQVVGAYMDVIQNEALVGLAANNVNVLEVNLQATSDRFEIGDLTRTDVAQSESRLALARGDLRTAQSNLIRAREMFVALV